MELYRQVDVRAGLAKTLAYHLGQRERAWASFPEALEIAYEASALKRIGALFFQPDGL